MKAQGFRRLCSALCTALILIGAAGMAYAHTMPHEEAVMILPKPPYGELDLVPHKSTLFDVRAGFGADFKERDFTGDGMRIVRYNYNDRIIFMARTGAMDPRPSKELKIIGYDILSSSLHTPSHFHVGDPFTKVTEKYGEPSTVIEENGTASQIYSFEGHPSQLIFDVDADGIIRAIRYRTEA